jgi:hypothetical protein
MMISRALLLIGGVAFILNFPFGMLRSRLRKYSIGWLLCIHLPIVPIILIRVIEGLTYRVIPRILGTLNLILLAKKKISKVSPDFRFPRLRDLRSHPDGLA